MDKRAFVEAQNSSREAPAHFWRKKSKVDTLERIRETVSLHPSPLPHGGIAQCQERPTLPISLPMGKRGSM